MTSPEDTAAILIGKLDQTYPEYAILSLTIINFCKETLPGCKETCPWYVFSLSNNNYLVYYLDNLLNVLYCSITHIIFMW